mmetsp:Transcript_43064/g.101066  ORF Transcript_43064/g.101066 Transcript_43064/m.101066 type:complete len:212 (+) Transcript_43064:138-773(+)
MMACFHSNELGVSCTVGHDATKRGARVSAEARQAMAPPTKKCKLDGVEQPPIWLLPALAVLVCLVECIPDERSKPHVRHVDGAVTREGGLDHREELVLVGNHEARDEVGQGRSENGVCTLEPAGARETQRLFAFRALKDSEHLRALGVAHRDAVLDDDAVQRQRLDVRQVVDQARGSGVRSRFCLQRAHVASQRHDGERRWRRLGVERPGG